MSPGSLVKHDKICAGSKSLSLVGAGVQFGALVALEGVTLELRTGEVLGLIGPNGAGKTTAINLLTGFLTPTTGDVRLGDGSIRGRGPEQFATLGIMRTFQSGRLFSWASVVDNVAASAVGVLGLRRSVARERALTILDWLGCASFATEIAGNLAHGIQQRIGLARALAASPTFVLLDEPAAGLSRQDCDRLVSLILDVPQRFGCGVLLVEHNMSVIMSSCSKIHVLNSGKTLAEGTPNDVRNDPSVRSAYLGEHGRH